MTEQNARAADHDESTAITLSFKKETMDTAERLAGDLALAGGLNSLFLAAGKHIAFLGGSLSSDFTLFAAGVGVTAASITAGRHIGAAVGALVDRATHHTDGKYRKAFAIAAGTLAGLSTFAFYQSGRWAAVFWHD